MRQFLFLYILFAAHTSYASNPLATSSMQSRAFKLAVVRLVESIRFPHRHHDFDANCQHFNERFPGILKAKHQGKSLLQIAEERGNAQAVIVLLDHVTR